MYIAQELTAQRFVALLRHPSQCVAEEVALERSEPADPLALAVLGRLLERIEAQQNAAVSMLEAADGS